MLKKWITLLFLVLLTSSAMAADRLRLATTTSTDNSGLLAVLNPAFEEKFDVMVDVIAVGTGKALRLGANGDVDVVLVHAPQAELEYVRSGHFIDRTSVMHNDFVIVGPASDPANIARASNAAGAFSRIANAKADFVSRGDDSGTHKKEKALWDNANLPVPSGSWYVAAGQGMGAVLKIADEMQAYALADRGTQIAYADKMDLTVLFEGDEVMFNPYHVMAVNPARHSIKYELASKYINFISSSEGQKIIADFRLKGQQLFHPDMLAE